MLVVRLPEVPVIVSDGADPMDAAPFAVSVSVLVPVVLVGFSEAVTPFGKPDSDKPTVPLKPSNGFTVMVLVALLP